MIKLENTDVMGWEAAIRGMRNPMNSWEKSDSWFPDLYKDDAYTINGDTKPLYEEITIPNADLGEPLIGANDHKLMLNLAKAGSVDAKYRRMIVVAVDITAPLYWWKEFDTYKIGTVANSCSTMHKIHAKEFTLEDFSCEHLFTWPEEYDKLPHFEPDISYDEEGVPTVLKYAAEKEIDWHYDHGAYVSVEDYDSEGNTWIDTKYARDVLTETVEALNYYREKFLEAKELAKSQKEESDRAKRVGQVPVSSGRYFEMMAKKYWWQMIQLLPSSYNQRRTVMLNYEVLAGIYPKRKDHKLDEWHTFCNWIESLPYSDIITLEEA